MRKLKAKGLRWLKGFHLIAVSCWIGGVVSLILLYFLKNGVTDGGVLYGINQSIHHVDIEVVVIPGAFGCLLTGLIYASFSDWGFLKHTWLILKWVVINAAILVGAFFLGPWKTTMVEISGKLGMSSLSDQAYLYNEKMSLIFEAVQALLLMVTVFISVFKPWKKKKIKEPR
jgi:uncharacterized membrane protein